MWLHIIKGNVSSSVYTNYSCNQPPWDQPLVVSQGFSVLCNLMIQCPMTCCAVHIGTHKIFLEMISAGSWHLHALDMTSNVKGRGQMKMMRAVFGNESMARWSTGRGGVTEAHFNRAGRSRGDTVNVFLNQEKRPSDGTTPLYTSQSFLQLLWTLIRTFFRSKWGFSEKLIPHALYSLRIPCPQHKKPDPAWGKGEGSFVVSLWLEEKEHTWGPGKEPHWWTESTDGPLNFCLFLIQ